MAVIKPLKEQTMIVNSVKTQVSGEYNPASGEAQFSIAMNSYENTEQLEIDAMESIILEDGADHVWVPKTWDVLEKAQYRVSGRLLFLDISKLSEE